MLILDHTLERQVKASSLKRALVRLKIHIRTRISRFIVQNPHTELKLHIVRDHLQIALVEETTNTTVGRSWLFDSWHESDEIIAQVLTEKQIIVFVDGYLTTIIKELKSEDS